MPKNNKKIVLNEAPEWNFHISRDGGEHDMRPYGSDNKYQMVGRDTGHFGSGTYFSTYPRNGYKDKYTGKGDNNPEFIKVDDKVYRVDFDLYKNLYRVNSKRQGDVLFTMLQRCNAFFNQINDMGKFNQRYASYNNAKLYQEIKANANALGLKCPSYYDLTRMAQSHQGVQSFSTVFMEYNGFNGVNVSGIDYYDNTLHGSVIYDLSKTNGDMEQIKPKDLFNVRDGGQSNTLAYKWDDIKMNALEGNDYMYSDKLKDMDKVTLMRVLKNNIASGKPISVFRLRELGEDVIKSYLKLAYQTYTGVEILDGDQSKYFVELIDKYKLYYWVNYFKSNTSGLIALLHYKSYEVDWNLSDEEVIDAQRKIFNELKPYLHRELEWKEEKFLMDFLGENKDTNENKRYNITHDMKINLKEATKAIVNEVLDGLNDTEKKYWLMRQRQQRPNTKSKTPVNYEKEFQHSFNGSMNRNNVVQNGQNMGFASPQSPSKNGYNYGVDPQGNFTSSSYSNNGNTYAGMKLSGDGSKDSYTHRQSPNAKFTHGDSQQVKNDTASNANAQAQRYSDMRQRYNQKYGQSNESVKHGENLCEARVDPVQKIQSLIDQANQAYHQALEHQGGGDWPLMDKKGETYGLKGDIKLDKRGYVTIPIDGGPYGEYGPSKIRVLAKVDGKIKVIQGDFMEEGWKDVAKILKQIIRDAGIGNGEFTEYDPNWEDTKDKESLRVMNKKIGRNANAGMEYLESVIRESVRKMLKEEIEGMPQLWAEVRFVQGGDEDYDEILNMFCGEENADTAYCAGYSQPVIDYLKQWDGEGSEIVDKEPRIARSDTEYADENGEYTLLYNGSVGGCFLLYRPANEQEIDWYMNRR